MEPTELTCDQTSEEAVRLYLAEYNQLSGRTDRLIAWIMGIQWIGAIIVSLVIPSGSRGGITERHPYFLVACLIGGLLTLYPIYLAVVLPGQRTTRHLIAGCQILMSGLLIHITSGRIETHFHVFGSIALLSLYLDWQVLITATTATFIDHVLMGYFMPACLFGSPNVSHWRIVEHVLWVVVFDIFLIYSCVQGQRRLKVVAKRESEQVYQAYHDALTGLGNRLLFERLMEETIETQVPYTFMALDLDKFKETNDTLGHHVGDEVLSLASDRMRAEVRAGDHLIRMGGDEFALILPNCSNMTVAESIAQRIIDSLNRPFRCQQHEVHIGVSIGISYNYEGSLTAEDILQAADLALYKVKNNGRNHYVVFDGTLEAETLHNINLEHRLRNAVAAGSLELHYQPIVNTRGILLGFEALLRWNDAVHGSVSPAEFIPVAERCGLIVSLGEWVLRTACTQAAEWNRAGMKLVKMSVNVSSIQLTNGDFVATVLNTLKDTGLPANMLHLELTESTLIQKHDETLKSLEVLHKFGVRLSIDDFGTGYSSLSYLRDLPVHTLKIDRAFVKNIVRSVDARLLIEGMINMAHTLKLRVVAEGVETREQLEVLTLAGCDEIQGFHFSRAVPSEEANKLMRCVEIERVKELTQTTLHEIPLRLATVK